MRRNQFRSVVPRLPVTDLTATLEFYVSRLGLRPLYRYEGEAGVGVGEILIRFCQGDPVLNDDLSIYFEISNTNELFEKYESVGVDVIFPPRDQPWGSRDFCIRDPDGYQLVFGDFRDDTYLNSRPPRMAEAIEMMQRGEADPLRTLLEADRELVRNRVQMRYSEVRKGTLLHCLMDYPDGKHASNVVEIARLLVDYGAEVDSLDGTSEGSTALQLLMAIDKPLPKGVELTELLLEQGASVTQASDDLGMDSFTLALLNGQTECAAAMFERGYPPDFAWAGAGLGKMDLVRGFFGEDDGKSGLPAEERADHLGDDAQYVMNCAFLVAAINGQTKVVEHLVDKGMDVDMQPPGSDFAGVGATALHWAARFGRAETVELLLMRGANALARDDVFQLTPAGWAGGYGHDEISRLLLAREAEANS